MKDFLKFILEVFQTAVLAFLIVFPIRYFIFQPFVVSGSSMSPHFSDRDYLLIDEISFRFKQPERGEVIVFRSPLQPSTRYIKRIIGLPGETVEIIDGRIYLIEKGGEKVRLDESEYLAINVFTAGNINVTLRENEYYVLGDNRMFSSDSRAWGTLPKENIIGKAFFRALPLPHFSSIVRPSYELVPVNS